MIDQPKVFNHPGIDTPLREQTLAEFVMVLDENHLVRRELRELQRRSAESARLSAENTELQKQVELLKESNIQAVAAIVDIPDMMENKPPSAKIERIPCPLCSKQIAKGKAYWNIHFQKKHAGSQEQFPYPG